MKDFTRFALPVQTHELVDERTSARMWTLQKTTAGKSSQYGLGLLVSGSGRDLKISHNGRQNESRTRLALYPSRDHGTFVMCNTPQRDQGKISTAIYTALSEK